MIIVFSNRNDQDEANSAEELYPKAIPNVLILKTHDSGRVKVSVPFSRDGKIGHSKSK